jgi:hypothetical protein
MKIIFDETNAIQLKHPTTGEPLENAKGKPMTVEIYGKHTSTYKNAVNDMFKKRTGKELTSEETKRQGNELLACCIKQFNNLDIEYAEGKFLDPNDIVGCLENAFWIREQVDTEITNLENFLQTPKHH